MQYIRALTYIMYSVPVFHLTHEWKDSLLPISYATITAAAFSYYNKQIHTQNNVVKLFFYTSIVLHVYLKTK